MLEIKSVDAGYQFLQVLWGVSLRVDDGEFVEVDVEDGRLAFRRLIEAEAA